MRKNCSGIRQSLTPWVSVAIHLQPNCETFLSDLRHSLGSKLGVKDRHLRGILALDTEARADLISRLLDAHKREAYLDALDVLCRCGCDEADISSTDLAALADMFTDARGRGVPVEQVVKLVKAWRHEDFPDIEHLADVLNWLASSKAPLKARKWSRILSLRLKDLACDNVPLPFPDRVGQVIARQLVSGAQLLEEGRAMGHCLADPDASYQYARMIENHEAAIFHLTLMGTLQEATLAIKKDRRGWKCADFETVGRGTPGPRLQEAADYLKAFINRCQGFRVTHDQEGDWEAEEDWDEILNAAAPTPRGATRDCQ